MSWVITGSEKNPVDLYRSQVSLLLHGDGTNGSTTIIDSSPTPKTVTAFGNAQISTAQSKFPGGSSIAFDGNGDYLIGLQSDSDNYNLSGNFTVEAWVYINSFATTPSQAIAGKWRSSHFAWVFQISSTKLAFASGNNGAFGFITEFNTSVQTGNWHHVAVSRSGSALRLFHNGTLLGTATDSFNCTAPNTTSTLHVGVNQDGLPSNTAILGYLNGYIDDLRITKGIARYTSNFTPPTAPFPDI
jgi:hypothetical protein